LRRIAERNGVSHNGRTDSSYNHYAHYYVLAWLGCFFAQPSCSLRTDRLASSFLIAILGRHTPARRINFPGQHWTHRGLRQGAPQHDGFPEHLIGDFSFGAETSGAGRPSDLQVCK